eukprot:CFRG1605T1
MGNGQSTPVAEILDGSYEGYHVVKVHRDSPADLADLTPFFDYIVSINGHRLDKEDSTLADQLNSNVGMAITIIVYNSRIRAVRELTIVPSNSWGGTGLLGASIRFCSFENAAENVWHILEVQPDSPVSKAGIRSNIDYIIGSSDTTLYDQNSFYSLVETMDKQPMNLYVYDISNDTCREVIVTPDMDWGGDGSLGCSIGYGLLHRIPPPGSTGNEMTGHIEPDAHRELNEMQMETFPIAPLPPPPKDAHFIPRDTDSDHPIANQPSFHHHAPHLYHDLDGVHEGPLERNSITSAPDQKESHEAAVKEYLHRGSSNSVDTDVISEPFQLGGVSGVVAAPYQMATLSRHNSPLPTPQYYQMSTLDEPNVLSADVASTHTHTNTTTSTPTNGHTQAEKLPTTHTQPQRQRQTPTQIESHADAQSQSGALIEPMDESKQNEVKNTPQTSHRDTLAFAATSIPAHATQTSEGITDVLSTQMPTSSTEDSATRHAF